MLRRRFGGSGGPAFFAGGRGELEGLGFALGIDGDAGGSQLQHRISSDFHRLDGVVGRGVVHHILQHILHDGAQSPGTCPPLDGDAGGRSAGSRDSRDVRNPADARDLVGRVVEAGANDVDDALRLACDGAATWASRSPADRAAVLDAAAARLEALSEDWSKV